MSAPPKPWERVGVSSHSQSALPVNSMSGEAPGLGLGLPVGVGATTASPAVLQRASPPLPARPAQQSTMSTYGGYGTGLGGYGTGLGGYGSSYGSSMYGPHSGYGGMYGGGMYGGYGSSYNRFGTNDYTSQNGFVRAAEESSRQAFQSVESIVQAFGSVAMMLESTFSAVYNSFRAVIGVADHFSRMKSTFAQIFSALAIWRTIRWLFRKLLVLLRLRPPGLDDDVWKSAMESGAETLSAGGNGPGKSNWPLMLFLTVALGGPWLIWKLLSSLNTNQEGSEWANGTDDHFVAVAEHSFDGENDDELSFRTGRKIKIAPKELQPRMRGWLLASVDGKKVGIIPANYVKILGKQKGHRKLAPEQIPAIVKPTNSLESEYVQSVSQNKVVNNATMDKEFAATSDSSRPTLENEQNYQSAFNASSVFRESEITTDLERTADEILKDDANEISSSTKENT